MTINGDLVLIYKDYVAGSFQALLPLIGIICGIFLAFAIANQLRFLIMKMK